MYMYVLKKELASMFTDTSIGAQVTCTINKHLYLRVSCFAVQVQSNLSKVTICRLTEVVVNDRLSLNTCQK